MRNNTSKWLLVQIITSQSWADYLPVGYEQAETSLDTKLPNMQGGTNYV
jgi:hypothetical protein